MGFFGFLLKSRNFATFSTCKRNFKLISDRLTEIMEKIKSGTMLNLQEMSK